MTERVAYLPSSILKWSSQYGYRSYSMSCLMNGCEFFPDYGDNCHSAVFRYFGSLKRNAVVHSAYLQSNHVSSLSPFRDTEAKALTSCDDFIILYYENPLSLKEVHLFEVYNTGCLRSISGCLIDKQEDVETNKAKWTLLWNVNSPKELIYSKSADGSEPNTREMAVRQECFIDVLPSKRVINCLCLEFNSDNVDYYTEIDCIEAIGDAIDLDLFNPLAIESSVDDEFSNCINLLSIKDERSSQNSEDSETFLTLLKMPDEIIRKIFESCSLKSLGQVSATCRRLYSLAHDYSLYRSIDFRPLWKSFNDDDLDNFTQKCQTHNWDVKSLSFEWCFKLSNTSIESLLQNTPNLSYLNLANTSAKMLENLDFGIIARYCPKLESLVLRMNHEHEFNGFASSKNLTALKTLKIFSLESCRTETAQLPKLRDWITSNASLTFLSLDAMLPRFDFHQTNLLLEKLSKNCPNLEFLNLCRQSVNDASFIHMSSMRSLKGLDVGWSYRPDVGMLEYNSAICQMLISKRGHFTTLIFTACRGFNIDSLSCIAATQPNLKCLDILGVSALAQGGKTLEELFKNCPNLKYIDLSYINGISDREVAVFMNMYTKIDIKRAHTCKADEEFYRNMLSDPRYGLTSAD